MDNKSSIVDKKIEEIKSNDGKSHSIEILTYSNGVIYETNYIDGVKNGKYLITYPEGGTEEGFYINGVKQGKCIEKFLEGAEKESTYVSGVQQGKYILKFSNGDLEKGNYINGVKQGEFEIHTVHGELVKGNYVNGKINEMHFANDKSYQLAIDEWLNELFCPVFQEEFEVRIGEMISSKLSNDQLMEFDAITESEKAAEWLEKNCPEYRRYVDEIKEKTADEVTDWSKYIAFKNFKLKENTLFYCFELLYRGDKLLKDGYINEALEYHKNAFELYNSLNKEENCFCALICNSISKDYICLNQYNEAIKYAVNAEKLLMSYECGYSMPVNAATVLCNVNLLRIYYKLNNKAEFVNTSKKIVEYTDMCKIPALKKEIEWALKETLLSNTADFTYSINLLRQLEKYNTNNSKHITEIISKLLAEAYAYIGDYANVNIYSEKYLRAAYGIYDENTEDIASVCFSVAKIYFRFLKNGGNVEECIRKASGFTEKAAEIFKNLNEQLEYTRTINFLDKIKNYDFNDETTVEAKVFDVDDVNIRLQEMITAIITNKDALPKLKEMLLLFSEIYKNVVKEPRDQLRANYLREIKKGVRICYVAASFYSNELSAKELYDFTIKTSNIDAEIESALSKFYRNDANQQIKSTKEVLNNLQKKRSKMLINENVSELDLVEINEEIKIHEDTLFDLISLERIKDPLQEVSVDNIMDSLSKNESIIEYVHIPNYTSEVEKFLNSFNSDKTNITSVVKKYDDIHDTYCVFTITKNKIEFKFIHVQNEVNKLADELYATKNALQRNDEESYNKVLNSLELARNSLVEPCFEHLKNTKRLYIVPDGLLYKMPFELLVDENIILGYLSSGREILNVSSSPTGDGITVIANPQYDIDSDTITDFDDGVGTEYNTRSADITSLLSQKTIKILPFTSVEASEAITMFNRSKTDIWEKAIKRSVTANKESDILHIATHGYFNDGKTENQTDENSLSNFGLLFSGVSNWLRNEYVPEYFEDGITNGYDLLSSNLSQYKLLVLSACQTGLGIAESGEGIKGLRRSFELAGINNIICTLWNVDDCACALLMSKFYELLAQDPNSNIAFALKGAKEYVRNISGNELAESSVKSRLLEMMKCKVAYTVGFRKNCEIALRHQLNSFASFEKPFKHPYYWAGFILQGKYESFDSTSDFTGTKRHQFTNGNTYEGEWKNGKMHGNGILTYANGSVYTGEFKDGKKEGKGTYISFDGEKYEGEWKNNKRNGNGKLEFSNGFMYYGEFFENSFSGYGGCVDANGVYDGQWLNGKQHGKGKKTFISRNVYEGDWAEGFQHGKGILVFSNGDRYEGDFVKGFRTGKGKCSYSNGNVYEGDWVDGEKYGKGIFVWHNGDKYEGNFVADKRTGYGVYIWQNGVKYEGDFLNGQRTGKGTIIWTNGDRYEGDFVKGFRTGKGKCSYSNGNVYEGDWDKNKKQGVGTYIYSNGDKYEGEWLNGQMSGEGVYIWNNGDIYCGEWLNGNMHGKGKIVNANGDIYEGDWIEDKKHGKGMAIWSNGEKYEGDFINGACTGKGALTYPNGDKYEGDFLNNNRTGNGLCIYSDGKTYYGEWLNGKRNGYAVYTLENGNILKGFWVDDEYIGNTTNKN